MKEKRSHSLTLARQAAAEILAAAAVELFPDTILFQGQGTDKLFFYDFIFPFSFQPEFLPNLEERMRQIIKRGEPVKVLEMVPGNAAALLEHSGQPVLAGRVREVDQSLVRIVHMGAFADWCEEPLIGLENSAYPIKLIEFFPVVVGEDTLVRIVGVLEEDKEILKKVVKGSASYAEGNHLRLIKELDLFMPMEDLGDGLWSWLPKADAVKELLLQWWRREHLQQNFQLMTSPSCLHVSEDEDPGFYLMRAHRSFWERGGLLQAAGLLKFPI